MSCTILKVRVLVKFAVYNRPNDLNRCLHLFVNMTLTVDDAYQQMKEPEFEDNEALQGTIGKVMRALQGYHERNNTEEKRRRAALLNEIRKYYGFQPVAFPHVNGDIVTNSTLKQEGLEPVDYSPSSAERAGTKGAGESKPSDTVKENFEENVPEGKQKEDMERTETVVTNDPTEHAQEPYLTDYPGLDDAGYSEEDGKVDYNKTRGEATGFTGVEDFDPAPLMSEQTKIPENKYEQKRNEQGQFAGGLFDPEMLEDVEKRDAQTVRRNVGESEKFTPVEDFTDIKGIGPSSASTLQEMGIDSIGQLRRRIRENPELLHDADIPPVHRKTVMNELGL